MAFRLPGQHRLKPNKARAKPPASSLPSGPQPVVAPAAPKAPQTQVNKPAPASNGPVGDATASRDAQIGSSQLPDLTQAITQDTQDTLIATPAFKDIAETTRSDRDAQTTPAAATTAPTTPLPPKINAPGHADAEPPALLPRPSPIRHPSSSAAHAEHTNASLSEKDKSPPYMPPTRTPARGLPPRLAPGLRNRSLTPMALASRSAGPSALLKAAAAQAESGYSGRPSPGRIPSRKSRSSRSESIRVGSVPPGPEDGAAGAQEDLEGLGYRSADGSVSKTAPDAGKELPAAQTADTEKTGAQSLGRQQTDTAGDWDVDMNVDMDVEDRGDGGASRTVQGITQESQAADIDQTTATFDVAHFGQTSEPSVTSKQLKTARGVASREDMINRVRAKVLGKKSQPQQVSKESSWAFAPQLATGVTGAPASISSVLQGPSGDAHRGGQSGPHSQTARPSRKQASSTSVAGPPEDANMDHDSAEAGASRTGQTEQEVSTGKPSGPKYQVTVEITRPGASKYASQTAAQGSNRGDQTSLFEPASPASSTASMETAYEEPGDTGSDSSDVQNGPRVNGKLAGKGNARKTKESALKPQPVAAEEDEQGEDGEEEMDVDRVRKKAKKRKSANGEHTRLENQRPKKKKLHISQVPLTDLAGGDQLGDPEIDIAGLTMADLALNMTSGVISPRGVVLDDFIRATQKQNAGQLPMRRWTRWEKEQIYRRHQRRQANQARAARREEAVAQGLNPDNEVSMDEEDSEEEFEIHQDRFTPPPDDAPVERVQPLSLLPAEEGMEGEGDEDPEAAAARDALYDQAVEDEEDVDENNMDVNPDEMGQDYDPVESHAGGEAGEDPYANLEQNGDYAPGGHDVYDEAYGDATQMYLEERDAARDEHRRRQEMVEAIQEDEDTKMVNSRTYSKVRNIERWTKTETEFFFDVNPFMLQGYFPGRTQPQLKRKMNKEYKANKERYLQALQNKRRVDTVYLEKSAGFNNEKDYTEEIAWLEQLREETERLKTGDVGALPDDQGLETFDEEKDDAEEKDDEGGDKEELFEDDGGDKGDDDYDDYDVAGLGDYMEEANNDDLDEDDPLREEEE